MFKTILLSMLIIPSAFAGDRAGNGGDVLVCKSRKHPDIQFFDHYEAKTRGLVLQLNKDTIEGNVKFAISHLAKIDKFNAQLILEGIRPFLEDIKLYESHGPKHLQVTRFTNDALNDVQDTIETTIPKDCKIEQLILHNNTPYWNIKAFTVSEKFWNKLSLQDKSMAVIHEALYVHFSSKGWNDSRIVRHLNSVLNSVAVSQYTFDDYLKDLSINFPKHSNLQVFVPGPEAQEDVQLSSSATGFRSKNCSKWGYAESLTTLYGTKCFPVDPKTFSTVKVVRNSPILFKNEAYVIYSVVMIHSQVIGYEAILLDLGNVIEGHIPDKINYEMNRLIQGFVDVPKVYVDPDGKISRLERFQQTTTVVQE